MRHVLSGPLDIPARSRDTVEHRRRGAFSGGANALGRKDNRKGVRARLESYGISPVAAVPIFVIDVLPLAGMIWWGWSVVALFFLYWFEAAVSCVATCVEMVICRKPWPAPIKTSLTSTILQVLGIGGLLLGISALFTFGILHALRDNLVVSNPFRSATGFQYVMVAVVVRDVLIIVVNLFRGTYKETNIGELSLKGFEPVAFVFLGFFAFLFAIWPAGMSGGQLHIHQAILAFPFIAIRVWYDVTHSKPGTLDREIEEQVEGLAHAAANEQRAERQKRFQVVKHALKQGRNRRRKRRRK